MTFFTTRDKLEIAGIPFAVPEDKPNRRQAIAYYQAVADCHDLEIALFENVVAVEREGELFQVRSEGRAGVVTRWARAVAFAIGYFTNPLRLGVPGEDQPWVRSRYREPWEHHGEDVAVIGAGNSGAEVALELWRHGARVTLIHRGDAPKATIKYWVRPDLENRIEEGSIRALLGARVLRFGERVIEVAVGSGIEVVSAAAAYVLIGYEPETGLMERAGVRIDSETKVPEFDPQCFETNVPGLYVAGTIQAGRETHRIFIENSRDHGDRIAEHLADRLQRSGVSARGT